MGRTSETDKVNKQLAKHNENILNLKRRSQCLTEIVKKYKAAIAQDNEVDVQTNCNNHLFNDLNDQEKYTYTQPTIGFYVDRAKYSPPEFNENSNQSVLKKLLEPEYGISKITKITKDSNENQLTLNEPIINGQLHSFFALPFQFIKENMISANDNQLTSEPEEVFQINLIAPYENKLIVVNDIQSSMDCQSNFQVLNCIDEPQLLSSVIDESFEDPKKQEFSSIEFWDNVFKEPSRLSSYLETNENLDAILGLPDFINNSSEMMDLDNLLPFSISNDESKFHREKLEDFLF